MATKQDYSQTMNKEMQQILDHAKALVDATSGEVDERIASARAALKQRLDAAIGEAVTLEGQLLDKVAEADKFIHLKPYYPIGGAFLAGVVLGWFVRK